MLDWKAEQSHKGKKKSFFLIISFKLKSYQAGKHSLVYADLTWRNHYHLIFACGYDCDPSLSSSLTLITLSLSHTISFPKAIILKVSYKSLRDALWTENQFCLFKKYKWCYTMTYLYFNVEIFPHQQCRDASILTVM